MKYKLSKTAVFAPKWNGNLDLPEAEQVKCDLNVMSLGDVLDLMDTLEGQADSEGNVNSDTMDEGTTTKLVNEAVRILPKYTTINNLEDQHGEEITVKNITEFPQFITLITEILFKLIEISSPNEDDVGNSNRLSDEADSLEAST